MQVERRRRARVIAAEFGVAAVADRDVFQPPVDDEIDQRRGGKDAIGDEVAAEPIERSADRRADDHDGEADFRIEVLSDVEVAAVADRAAIDAAVAANRVAPRQRDVAPAAAAPDIRRCFICPDGQRRIALRTMGQNQQRRIW